MTPNTPKASPALSGPTDHELRKMWHAAGGRFHGPNIETGTMSESDLLPFLRALILSPAQAEPLGQAGADARDAARYRWLRAQDNEDFSFAVVKNPHFDVYGSGAELDAAIDAAIASTGSTT